MEFTGPWKVKQAGLRNSFTKTANVLKAELVDVECSVDLVRALHVAKHTRLSYVQGMGSKMESPTRTPVINNLQTTTARQICTGEVTLMTVDNERELVDFVKCSTKILADGLSLWTYGPVEEAVRSAIDGLNIESEHSASFRDYVG
ncbi:hypothetical protein TNIN_437541 [Trichonephila inaurata madagascariensis]|uniref:Uncharacterized protein n=1 Tax=Trichonephila inaurata madagascariensis TaxID=2747483 RepID=A0A8X7CGT6_9ARAC|nr:hypothetical protein TNIN_437541 [Trichonephila inaurata madagascariensis]